MIGFKKYICRYKCCKAYKTAYCLLKQNIVLHKINPSNTTSKLR